MKHFLIAMTVFGLSTTNAFADNATPVSWLDDGATVSATVYQTEVDVQATSESATTSSAQATTASKTTTTEETEHVTITLSTNTTATLTGNVYVEAENPALVLAWAQANGYIALESPYITNAITVETTAAESINVANQIAEIEGVTTAAPRYQRKLIAK